MFTDIIAKGIKIKMDKKNKVYSTDSVQSNQILPQDDGLTYRHCNRIYCGYIRNINS